MAIPGISTDCPSLSPPDSLPCLERAEPGADDALESDIAFHVAVLLASRNPFYAQFRDVVSTALRTSIRFTNRVKGRTANVADHAAVRDAIAGGNPDKARKAMRALISDVLELIDAAKPDGTAAGR